jgi:carbon monoxide dehydrogenase subunit G
MGVSAAARALEIRRARPYRLMAKMRADNARREDGMKLEGSQTIGVGRDVVWAALNDPDVLKRCIPGCQSLEKTSDTTFEAVVKQKVGPVSATFTGVVELTNLNPPASYTISGEGKGGAAGFAKGGADVALNEVEGGTELTYAAEAKVGGKIAQLGARLIDGFAKKMADQFFTDFKATVEGDAGVTAAAAGPVPEEHATDAPSAAAAAAAAENAVEAPEKKTLWKRLFG